MTERAADSLARRRLGQSDLEVSARGFGGAAIGNLYSAITDESAEGAVRASLDAGVNYFDTAPLYGYGLSEHRIGRALRKTPRDSFVISTKVGRLLRPAPPERHDPGQFPESLPFDGVYDYS